MGCGRCFGNQPGAAATALAKRGAFATASVVAKTKRIATRACRAGTSRRKLQSRDAAPTLFLATFRRLLCGCSRSDCERCPRQDFSNRSARLLRKYVLKSARSNAMRSQLPALLLVAIILPATSDTLAKTQSEAPASGDVQVVEVTAKKYDFSPSPIRVK